MARIKMKAYKGKFKSKGSDILKAKASPSSMNEFLEDNQKEDVQMQKTSVAQLRNSTDTQTNNLTNVQNRNDAKTRNSPDENKSTAESVESEAVERIHVHIRKDLADKLIEMVYARKREGKVKKREASQRHIIEQALEEYFAK